MIYNDCHTVSRRDSLALIFATGTEGCQDLDIRPKAARQAQAGVQKEFQRGESCQNRKVGATT